MTIASLSEEERVSAERGATEALRMRLIGAGGGESWRVRLKMSATEGAALCEGARCASCSTGSLACQHIRLDTVRRRGSARRLIASVIFCISASSFFESGCGRFTTVSHA